jgi:hypothetical protein
MERSNVAISRYRLVRPELLKVPTRDGFLMEAMLFKPPEISVLSMIYSSSHKRMVKAKCSCG